MFKLLSLFFEEKAMFSLNSSQKEIHPLNLFQIITVNSIHSSDRESITQFFG
jgi:hypothetical protein